MLLQMPCLDHGFVRLVSYMQPAEGWTVDTPVGEMEARPSQWTGDLEVVRNARVSYNADWRAGVDTGSDERLIDRLVTHRHTTPIEAMVFTFEVKAPIFVVRQWHRHRTWTYNEISARYCELDEGFYVPRPEHIGEQHAKDKQMRTIAAAGDPNIVDQISAANIRRHCELAFATYHTLLKMKVPRELARGVLPVNAYTRMFATVNLHNLLHFIGLRSDPHAQYEIRVYSDALLELVSGICPVVIAKWKANRERLAGLAASDARLAELVKPECIDRLALALYSMGVHVPPRDTAFFQAAVRRWLETQS